MAKTLGMGGYYALDAAGDFNEDGHADLIVQEDSLEFFPGDGKGGLGAPGIFHGGVPIYRMIAVDLDGDGHLDLAGLTESGAGGGHSLLVIFPGQGDGTFGVPIAYDCGGAGSGIQAADLNHDGHLDLVVSVEGNSDGAINVFLARGDGLFQPRSSFPPQRSDFPLPLAVADFDGDGNPDLVLGGIYAAQYLKGDGAGGFGAPVDLDLGPGPTSVAVGDFNADGKMDIVAVNEGSFGEGIDPHDTISLRLGLGNGSFGARTMFQVGVKPVRVIAADLNKDGIPDVAVVSEGSRPAASSVTVLLGTRGSPVFRRSPQSSPRSQWIPF